MVNYSCFVESYISVSSRVERITFLVVLICVWRIKRASGYIPAKYFQMKNDESLQFLFYLPKNNKLIFLDIESDKNNPRDNTMC